MALEQRDSHRRLPPVAVADAAPGASGGARTRRARVLSVQLAACAVLGVWALFTPVVSRPGAWLVGFWVVVAVGGLAAPPVWRWGRHLDDRALTCALLVLDGMFAYVVVANQDRKAAELDVVLLLIPVTYAAVHLAPRWLRVQEAAVVLACAMSMIGEYPDVGLGALRAAIPATAFLATAEVVLALRLQLAASLAQVQQQALTDPLTGLLNRRGLDRSLASDAPGREGYRTVLMLDIDHFKTINDTLGHAEGDEVLRRFAAGLRHEARAEDLVVRLGGEEFAVLSRTPAEESAAMAERLLSLARSWLHPWSATVSIGVVALDGAWSVDRSRLAQVLQSADACLYDAKHTGRDRVVALVTT